MTTTTMRRGPRRAAWAAGSILAAVALAAPASAQYGVTHGAVPDPTVRGRWAEIKSREDALGRWRREFREAKSQGRVPPPPPMAPTEVLEVLAAREALARIGVEVPSPVAAEESPEALKGEPEDEPPSP